MLCVLGTVSFGKRCTNDYGGTAIWVVNPADEPIDPILVSDFLEVIGQRHTAVVDPLVE